ncbi:sigma-54-dependent Fis family transcriptional regulator [Pseudogracilibacillus auburnensis]|nr:sigma-54-dependent Fis family transcriptional regulator [Pseudogracilibacillus auburnensis]
MNNFVNKIITILKYCHFPGKLELANGGTLFLDEIGELSLEMQVKLLRALQEGEIYRIGGKKPIKVDIRVIVATNCDLEEMVRKGDFRSDLYYRLNIFPIHVTPLRERKKDIPLLVYTFLHELGGKYDYKVSTFNQEVMEVLDTYQWPGNIRELKNFIERLLIINESDDITASEILELLPNHNDHQARSLVDEKSNMKKERILETLEQTFGNKSITAKKLGISRATLYQRLKKYEING